MHETKRLKFLENSPTGQPLNALLESNDNGALFSTCTIVLACLEADPFQSRKLQYYGACSILESIFTSPNVSHLVKLKVAQILAKIRLVTSYHHFAHGKSYIVEQALIDNYIATSKIIPQNAKA